MQRVRPATACSAHDTAHDAPFTLPALELRRTTKHQHIWLPFNLLGHSIQGGGQLSQLGDESPASARVCWVNCSTPDLLALTISPSERPVRDHFLRQLLEPGGTLVDTVEYRRQLRSPSRSVTFAARSAACAAPCRPWSTRLLRAATLVSSARSPSTCPDQRTMLFVHHQRGHSETVETVGP